MKRQLVTCDIDKIKAVEDELLFAEREWNELLFEIQSFSNVQSEQNKAINLMNKDKEASNKLDLVKEEILVVKNHIKKKTDVYRIKEKKMKIRNKQLCDLE